jgi:hypothetical protein
MAELLGTDQIWVDGDWARRCGVEPDPANTGFGHGPAEVAAIRPDGPDVLVDYYETVWARTKAHLEGLNSEDLDRVVDDRWDPPVSLGVRLISIADDDVQHSAQAAYLRGLLRQ